MAHSHFPCLFSPLKIKNIELRNRVAISAHFAGWWVSDGLPNEDFAAYIEERAKGGIGLFVIGATGPTYQAGPDWMHNTSEAIVPRYRMLTAAGHRHGAKVFAQLIHTRDQIPGPTNDRIRVGMQAQVGLWLRQRPRPPERSASELGDLVRRFGAAATRARAGNIDGLELHAHEGFLHIQFLSPVTNQRQDHYGGPLVNRMRFIVETLEAMRTAIGDDMPLGVRLKAHDLEAGGMEVEDYVELVARLETMGLVDYISLTAGDGGLHHGPMPRPDGEWLPLVQRIKQSSGLPIMHAGRITTPEMAEAALARGQADVICMTKAHIADPHFARKVREGRLEDIRYCTRCLQSCIGNMEHMSCVYNPVTSRERTWAELEPAKCQKRVVVVGAGPAGMEAALVAHARGHEVKVLESSAQMGGQVPLAAASPMRQMFVRIAQFYQRQAAKGEFEVCLSTRATAASISALEPEAVVVATGSRARQVQVPGGRPIWTVSEALERDLSGVHKVLVVDRTGTMHAFMLADYLSERGIAVEYITPAARVAAAVDRMTREEMQQQLLGRGVLFAAEQDLVYWDGQGAVVRHNCFVEERLVKDIDTVVVAAGADPINGLSLELRGAVPQIHTIGDANTPRTVQEATLQGGLVGRML